MDRIQSEKQRLEENKRKLSGLSLRLNNEDRAEEREEDNSTNRFDYIFKIVIIGDATCGKTSLMKRYVDKSFHCDTLTTIGVDFNIKTFTVDDTIVKLQIWDTAGQEKFAPIGSLYYRGAQAVLLTFDITNKNSFENVEKWKEKWDCRQSGEEDSEPVRVLVGCKTDLEDMREVTREAAMAKAIKLGSRFAETSSKSGEKVDALFEEIARAVLDRKKNSKNPRLTSVSRSSSSPAESPASVTTREAGAEKRTESLPQMIRRFTTVRRETKKVRLSRSSARGTKSGLKCSIL